MKSQLQVNALRYPDQPSSREQAITSTVNMKLELYKFCRLARSYLTTLAALLVLVMISTISKADMPLVQILTEEMIEYQGDAAGFLGIAFGPDGGSPLQYTSNVNIDGGSFFYSLNAGQSYLGLPLSLTGSGTFDPMSNMMILSASGQYGSQPFLISGSDHLTFNADGSVSRSAGFDFLVDKVKLYDRHETTTYNTDGTSSSEGWFTNKDGDKIKGTDFTGTDKWDPKGQSAYNEAGMDGLLFYINSSGFSPPDGGNGSFTTTIAPVPEPASLVLFGSAALGLFAKVRSTYKR
jgi:hypothetical protein